MTPEAEKRIAEIVFRALGICSCNMAYTNRGRTDPNCNYHENYEDVFASIASAISDPILTAEIRVEERKRCAKLIDDDADRQEHAWKGHMKSGKGGPNDKLPHRSTRLRRRDPSDQGLTMNNKLFCENPRCNWRGGEDEVLKKQHPFITGDELLGCSKCLEVDCIVSACDEPDCWQHASCGIPTPEGYRHVCGKHYAQIEAAIRAIKD